MYLNEIFADLSIYLLETHSTNLATATIVLNATATGVFVSFIPDTTHLIFPTLVKGQVLAGDWIIVFVRQMFCYVQTMSVGIKPRISPDSPEAGVTLSLGQSLLVPFNPSFQGKKLLKIQRVVIQLPEFRQKFSSDKVGDMMFGRLDDGVQVIPSYPFASPKVFPEFLPDDLPFFVAHGLSILDDNVVQDVLVVPVNHHLIIEVIAVSILSVRAISA